MPIQKRVTTPVITPIIAPAMNWAILLKEVRDQLGDSLTRSLDSYNLKPKQDQSIIAGLAQFGQPDEFEPFNVIREANQILRHLSFSFFVDYEPSVIYPIIARTEVFGYHHHTHESAWILSANLLQWKQAVLEICQSETDFQQRFFMNCFAVLFNCNGYPQLWEGYERITLPDKTFVLRPRS